MRSSSRADRRWPSASTGSNGTYLQRGLHRTPAMTGCSRAVNEALRLAGCWPSFARRHSRSMPLPYGTQLPAAPPWIDGMPTGVLHTDRLRWTALIRRGLFRWSVGSGRRAPGPYYASGRHRSLPLPPFCGPGHRLAPIAALYTRSAMSRFAVVGPTAAVLWSCLRPAMAGIGPAWQRKSTEEYMAPSVRATCLKSWPLRAAGPSSSGQLALRAMRAARVLL